MRRHKRSAGLIKRSTHTGAGEEGSIVVEAALVMPVVIIVLLVFVILIRLSAMQMALHSAASQTVRQIAAHIHPVELAWKQVKDNNQPEELPIEKEKLPPWSEVAADAAQWLPDPAGTLISSALRGDYRPLQNMAATEIGRSIIEPLIHSNADGSILTPERIKLKLLTLPDLDKANESYVAIAVEYEFPIKLPFYSKPIILTEQAAERVWISDALPATSVQYDPNTDRIPLQITAIEPAPLRPGRQASVRVKTAPYAAVSLNVVYKSGNSKAKHLGEATADADGYVQWTWHVSGNTTPGIWILTVSEQGYSDNQVSRHFVVEKINRS